MSRLQHASTDLIIEFVETSSGKNYIILSDDGYSRCSWVYFLVSKHDASQAVEKFAADTRRGGIIKTIRSDNGSEFPGKRTRLRGRQ